MLLASRRYRLGRTLSHPLGLSDLERSLGVALPGIEVDVLFSDNHTLFKSDFEQILKAGKPYPVVKCTFTRWDKGPSVSAASKRELAGVWMLWVYPVARELRSRAREALLGHGLPALRAWLEAPRPPAWFFGRKVCELVWDPAALAVALEERVERI